MINTFFLDRNDEYLHLAQCNRKRWEREGATLVISMVQKLSQ